MELKPGFFRDATVAVLATAALASCSESAPDSPDNGRPTAPAAAVCLDGPTRPSELGEGDYEPLPELGNVPYEETESQAKIRTIGSVTIAGRKAVVQASGITAIHIGAFENALTQPLVGCMLAEHTKGVDIEATNGHENGAYNNNPDNRDKYDKIDVTLTETDDPEARYFNTTGSILSVLTHEGAHALYEDWGDQARRANNEGNGEAKALFDELDELYKQDMALVLEEYRLKHRESALAHLQQIYDKYKEEGNQPVAASVRHVMTKFDVPNGLAGIGISCGFGGGNCGVSGIEGMVWNASDEIDEKIEVADPHMNLAGFDDAEEEYKKFLETQFPASDESSTVPKVATAGHPYQNANELFASTINSDCLNPEEVLVKLRSLSGPRLELALKQRGVMMKMVSYFEPKLMQYMNTPDILKQM